MRKLLLIDEDRTMARLLSSLLAQHGLEVVHAVTLQDGQRRLDASIELVLLEAGLPDGDGFTALRTWRDHGERRPILMFTGRVDDKDCIRGLTLGADDYIKKPFNYMEVIARIQAALRRVGWGGAPGKTGDGLDRDERSLRIDGRVVPLTFTEYRLLDVLVGRPGRTFTRDELWEALDEEGTGGSFDRAIDLHIGRLRGKIEADVKEPRHLLTVRGVGYRWTW
ncbi:MAG: two component transcriptional regulator, winged helix family [Cyanobacteria bacterium RYN_339]|nr:two component transcriptional regulator, winged helix family [Cyanobacteria bacterium RYN_339]